MNVLASLEHDSWQEWSRLVAVVPDGVISSQPLGHYGQDQPWIRALCSAVGESAPAGRELLL